jgi:hypothetical protein
MVGWMNGYVTTFFVFVVYSVGRGSVMGRPSAQKFNHLAEALIFSDAILNKNTNLEIK